MNRRRDHLHLLLAVPFLSSALAGAAPLPKQGRVAAGVPRQIADAERVGRADAEQPLERILLVLPPKDPEARRAFMDAQQTPGAPEYHRWLSPAEFHARFGARPEDVSAVESWLAEQGFTVEPGHPGRSTLVFSAAVAQVETAFATRIGLYAKDGRPVIANESPALLPAGLASRVAGLVALDGFSRRAPLSHPARSVPLMTLGTNHLIAPADFSTIYGLDGLGSVIGTGAKIAVVGRTQINLDDTRFFRTFFGLPANDPTILLNGPDPGFDTSPGQPETFEANLDVQWSGGVAPGAGVTFVVSKSTDTSDGVDLSAQYAVEHDLADVVTVSFGACERDITAPGMLFYENLWAQAAAQGISAFVASGDSGAAGCDLASASSGTVAAVNGLCSSPWDTCVGGTTFLDQQSPSTYWSSGNDPTTKKSVLSYIPEAVWNESGAVPGGKSLLGTGGGISITFARPAWQTAPGVPSGAYRPVPDIALASAAHNSYLVFKDHTSGTNGLYGIYGTSAASPAFAGIAARLVQKTGGRVGNLNPTLYALGRAQYGGSGPEVFHDVTTGHNGVPSVPGFPAGPAYDQSTGLGSVDAGELFAAWSAAAPPPNVDFFLGATPGALLLAPGKSATVTVALSTLAGVEAMASIAASGLPSGMTASFEAGRLSANAATGYASVGVPAVLTLTAAANVILGTYPVVLTATSGSIHRAVTLFVTVSSAGTIPPASGVETQVPVVLDVFGNAGSHYTSDLVAVNRSTADATLQIRYAAAPGTPGGGGPAIARSLPAGRQLTVPDVIAFLRANGYALPTDTSTKLGTLFLGFAGVSDPALVFAGSRTSTPNQNAAVGGAFGTFAGAVPDGAASAGETWVYGLKENASFRSNLAVIHAPGGSSSLAVSGPISVEVQVFDGDTGAPAGAPIGKTLQPGEFWQLNGVLPQGAAGTANGYARVRRTAGTDRYITYGVVNDGGSAGGGTSDGSLIVSGGTGGLVPIVLDIPGGTHYQSEISLTNTASAAVTVGLVYTASRVFNVSPFSGSGSVTLAAGQQLQETNVLAWLRSIGIAIPATGPQGGTLQVTGAVAVARTWNPNPDTKVGGTYGVAYPALDAAHRATTGAWVYGLRQDADVRSNLALADARVGDAATRDYLVELYDADSGSASPVTTVTRTLAGGQWVQLDGVLNGTGIVHGYARIRPSGAASDFIAYGVVNDGPSPGTRTSDGSYLPMVVAN